MAYVPKSHEYNSPPPPPYVAYNPVTSGVQFQTQTPSSGQQQYFPSQPSSPSYIVVQPLGGFLGHHPQPMQCPVCRQQIVTVVMYEPGLITWLIAFVICFFGGIFGCCLIPFCIPACQDAIHRCPACHASLGRQTPF